MLPGETAVIFGRAVGRADEAVAVRRLDEARGEMADMATCVIVGTAETRLVERAGMAPLVYTPRSAAGGGEVIEAGEEVVDGRRRRRVGGAVDEDDRQPEGAGGGELGVGGGAAAVLGDEDLDGVVAEESLFVGLGEGAAGGEDGGAGEGVRVRGLDAAQEVAVLRGGAEGGDLLAADGEEDALRGRAEGAGGGGHVGDAGPAVAGLGLSRAGGRG